MKRTTEQLLSAASAPPPKASVSPDKQQYGCLQVEEAWRCWSLPLHKMLGSGLGSGSGSSALALQAYTCSSDCVCVDLPVASR